MIGPWKKSLGLKRWTWTKGLRSLPASVGKRHAGGPFPNW